MKLWVDVNPVTPVWLAARLYWYCVTGLPSVSRILYNRLFESYWYVSDMPEGYVTLESPTRSFQE